MLNLLSPELIDSIETYTEPIFIKKGDFIFSQETICHNIFWIRKGICRRYYLHNGKEITTEFLFSDSFVVSSKSFVLSQPTSEFAQALTNIEALTINRSNFNEIKIKHPELVELDLKLVELYAIWLENRIFEFQTQDATTRYQNLIKKNPHYIQQIPLMYIASFLGISLETLSRIRAKI